MYNGNLYSALIAGYMACTAYRTITFVAFRLLCDAGLWVPSLRSLQFKECTSVQF